MDSYSQWSRDNPLPNGFLSESQPGFTLGSSSGTTTGSDTDDRAASQSHISISQLHEMPGRVKSRTLHPKRLNGSTWFKYDKKITNNIKGMIHGNFKRPGYGKFKDFPKCLSNSWWESFAQEFNWEKQDEPEIKRLWTTQASSQFSNHVSEWKKKWRNGEKKPAHVRNKVWEWFQTYWLKEHVKVLSARNSRNRRGKEGKAEPKTHNNGSRTFEMTEDDLTIKANGIKPDYMTLMEITHTNKTTKEIDNKRVAGVLTKAKRKVQHLETQVSQQEDEGVSPRSLSTKEINQIIYEEAATAKGVFGLGTVPLRHQEAESAMMPPPTQQMEETIVSLKEQLNAETEARKKMEQFMKTMGYVPTST